ncbi:MAG: hypothetical protein QOF55_1963 [Thermoleophilaceae bacterium]|jgi:hypothetical protein|nr:hypothetical protein [Thermoleophilaceae bacterium]
MKGLLSLAVIGGLVYAVKLQEPEIRRYLKVKTM